MDLPTPSELFGRSDSDFVPYYEPPAFSEESSVTYAPDDNDMPLSPPHTTNSKVADPTITSAQAEGSEFSTITPPDRPGRRRPLPHEQKLDTVIPAAAAVEAFKRAAGASGGRSHALFRSPNDTNNGDDGNDDGNDDIEHEEPIPLVQRKDKQPMRHGSNMSTRKAIAMTGTSLAATGTTGTDAGTTEVIAVEEGSDLPPDKKSTVYWDFSEFGSYF